MASLKSVQSIISHFSKYITLDKKLKYTCIFTYMYKILNNQTLCVILTNLDPIEHTLFTFSPFCFPKCAHILTISGEHKGESYK